MNPQDLDEILARIRYYMKGHSFLRDEYEDDEEEYHYIKAVDIAGLDSLLTDIWNENERELRIERLNERE
jgi:hypothetical protein